MIFIGDVHGKVDAYKRLVAKYEGPTIQVGDMGIGFADFSSIDARHWYIRGNHDNPGLCRKDKRYLGDWFMDESGDYRIFGVSGARSIDSYARTEGVNFWFDEELSYDACLEAISHYSIYRPEIMVSHDCPTVVSKLLTDSPIESRTSTALQAMFERFPPRVWVFGHYHRSFDQVIDGTRFVCLNELEAKNIWIS